MIARAVSTHPRDWAPVLQVDSALAECLVISWFPSAGQVAGRPVDPAR
jgi:hypothetical protein